MKGNWKPWVGTLVICVSIFFGYSFGEFVASIWTDDPSYLVIWSFVSAVLFAIAVLTIIIKIDNRKKSKS